MLHATQTIASQHNFGVFANTRNCGVNTDAQRIRFAAADLFRQGRLAEADLLMHEAMQQYPDREDVLVMRALICEVRQDWHAAAEALEKLLTLQGPSAPVESWSHWVRVLRCDGQLHQAFGTVLQALQHHPGHPALTSELLELQALGVDNQAKAA